MNSMLRITACAAALAFAAPALAATKHHTHHAAHTKGAHHGKMAKSEGDSETAKLNAQSLEQAKSGAAPAGTPAPAASPAPAGAMAPPASAPAAPPADTTAPK